MTTEREALQMALEVLETIIDYEDDALHQAKYILRSALAEQPAQQQEPFAEVRLNKTGGNAGLSTHIVQLAEGYYPAGTKLYTTPQPAKRKPLPDAEILAKANEIPQFIWTEGCSYETGVLQEEAIAFARAVEAAHQIGVEK